MEIRPVGAELFHAGGRTDTDMTKLIIAFRDFANAPKKSSTEKLMLDPPLAHNELKPSGTIAGLKPETQHTHVFLSHSEIKIIINPDRCANARLVKPSALGTNLARSPVESRPGHMCGFPS